MANAASPRDQKRPAALTVAGDHRLQHRAPAFSAMNVAGPQDAALQVAELVEDEERMVAGAAEVPVPGRALLLAIGRALGTVHVEDDAVWRSPHMHAVDPGAGQVPERREVRGPSGWSRPPVCPYPRGQRWRASPDRGRAARDQRIARRKLSLLELAHDLGNVRKACRLIGYSRQQFYEIRRNYQTCILGSQKPHCATPVITPYSPAVAGVLFWPDARICRWSPSFCAPKATARRVSSFPGQPYASQRYAGACGRRLFS